MTPKARAPPAELGQATAKGNDLLGALRRLRGARTPTRHHRFVDLRGLHLDEGLSFLQVPLASVVLFWLITKDFT